MGLDMYLRAQKYVGGWKHSPEENREEFKAVLSAVGWTEGDVSSESPSVNVSVAKASSNSASATKPAACSTSPPTRRT